MSHSVGDNPVEAAPTSGESEEEDVEEEALNHGPLLILDVFLNTGVPLPVEACDVLGVLYLKLLYDEEFKQKYTCHLWNGTRTSLSCTCLPVMRTMRTACGTCHGLSIDSSASSSAATLNCVNWKQFSLQGARDPSAAAATTR
ncbi:hypothetical protein DVH05_013363 [Phytophthora capsici]|nr:hypothetical protein DVH05_013363 [Phytophthora capsici]